MSESFVLRLLGPTLDDADLVGEVESVSSGHVEVFHSSEELLLVLRRATERGESLGSAHDRPTSPGAP